MKQCGDCTKCCDGSLTATIRGHDMYPGKPCFFVQLGKGCGDYDNRPEDPCRSYKCFWLSNEDMPEEFKPSLSGIIINFHQESGLEYLKIVQVESVINKDLIDWIIGYITKLNINAAFHINDKIYYIGSTKFVEVMNG